MTSRKKHTSWVVWLRRSIQTFFLLCFFYLFLKTQYYPFNVTGGPVDLFFHIDPLVTVGTFFATHAIPFVQWVAVITLIVTLIFGRWFCGWICPFGVLHNFFTGLRRRKMKDLMEQGTYSQGQKTKYYILLSVLIAALLGVNAVGWMDPFSFFYRSLATAVYPAVNWGMESFFTGVYSSDPHFGPLHATSVTEPIYESLRDHFLAVKQPMYVGGIFIGVLFLVVVGLNFYKGRYWCRYLCPLGALLGVVGKNPMLRLTKNAEQCHNCRICLADCQGGAQPQTISEWKPSECFYCWNCSDACATEAISFRFESSIFGRRPTSAVEDSLPAAHTMHAPAIEKSQILSSPEIPRTENRESAKLVPSGESPKQEAVVLKPSGKSKPSSKDLSKSSSPKSSTAKTSNSKSSQSSKRRKK